MPEQQQTHQSIDLKSTNQRQTPPITKTPISNLEAIIQRARINPKSLTHADIIQLQGTVGNRAVGRLLSEIRSLSTAQKATVHRQEIPKIVPQQAVQKLIKSGTLQAKLEIGQPNDIYEQEADRVADQVMSMPVSILQPKRECPLAKGISCQNDEDKKLRSKKLVEQEDKVPTFNSQVSPIVHEVLDSPGQLLDEATSSLMGSHFGYDFNHVKIYTDAKAAEATKTLGAEAFTLGHKIVFNASRYSPETHEGKRLLAHELAHVVQQRSADASTSFNATGETVSHLEVETRRANNRFLNNQNVDIAHRSTNNTLQRGILDTISDILGLGKIFGVKQCSFYHDQYIKLLAECKKEYNEHCTKTDIESTLECIEWGGSGHFTDMVARCARRKNPKLFSLALEKCGESAIDSWVSNEPNEVPSNNVASNEVPSNNVASNEVPSNTVASNEVPSNTVVSNESEEA